MFTPDCFSVFKGRNDLAEVKVVNDSIIPKLITELCMEVHMVIIKKCLFSTICHFFLCLFDML